MDKISQVNFSHTPQKTQKAKSKGLLRQVYENVTDGVQDTLDTFIPGMKPVKEVDINTNIPGYSNVSSEDGAKMLGYFTQKMEAQGFPWALYKPCKGILKKRKAIGDFEALQRLQKGEPVIFQPKRVIGIGFSPPQFKGKDVTGKEGAGKVDVKSGGMEVQYGEPIQINNLGELKFLYELYNPDIQVDPNTDNKLKVAARSIAYFTKGTMASQYPWKMFKPVSTGRKILNMAKSALKTGGIGAGLGALAASIFSLPAIAFGSFVGGPIGIAAGAAIGFVLGAFKGTASQRHGQEINPMEALVRLTEGKPVYFQEMKKREIGLSIPFPIGMKLGNLSFYGEHGSGSTIHNLDELELFHKMEEQK